MTAAKTWRALKPDPSIVVAIQHAGPRPEDGNQDAKRHWSESFADACAVAIADELRKSKILQKKTISPEAIGKKTEKLVPLRAGTSKRIDVTVVDPILGLEIGVSLKGMNFRDSGADNYDKNLTGRLYELTDEVRLVHEHLPHAFMVGVLFLPMNSVEDKTDSADSSFARAVVKLRERTGRLDASLPGQATKCDAGYVALYTTGQESRGYPPGLCRLLNVLTSDPPRRGRPVLESTLSLAEMVEEVVASATFSSKTRWSPAEPD